MTAIRRIGLAAVALLLAASPGAADVRVVQSVGVAAIGGAGSGHSPPRDRALKRALRDAVHRVAREEAPDLSGESGALILDEVLGADPLDYANRFRILEDRGERPAILSPDPAVATEYVLLVEVSVNRDRVRERLAAADLLLLPSGDRGPPGTRTWLVLEALSDYAHYEAVREALLADPGVKSATPVEFSRERAVLQVDSQRTPDQLLRAVRDGLEPELRVVPLGGDRRTVILRVARGVPPRGSRRGN